MGLLAAQECSDSSVLALLALSIHTAVYLVRSSVLRSSHPVTSFFSCTKEIFFSFGAQASSCLLYCFEVSEKCITFMIT